MRKLLIPLVLFALFPATAAGSPYLTFHRAESYLESFDRIQEEVAPESHPILEARFERCWRVSRSRIGCWEATTSLDEGQEWFCTDRVYVSLNSHNHLNRLQFVGIRCEPI